MTLQLEKHQETREEVGPEKEKKVAAEGTLSLGKA